MRSSGATRVVGIGDGLEQQRTGPVLGNGGGDGGFVVEIDEKGFHAGRRQHLHQHVDGGAVEGGGGEDDARAIDQRRCNRQMQRSHARGA